MSASKQFEEKELGGETIFLGRLSVIPRPSKLHRLPTQKFDATVIGLVYTPCSKNLTKKDFHKIF